MCQYCNIEDYYGEDIPFNTVVDGTKQHYEINVLDDLDYDRKSLVINGTFTELRIGIDYCPFCGNKL